MPSEPPAGIGGLLRLRAERSPAAAAIVDPAHGRTLDFAALAAAAEALAAQLRAAGIAGGDRVALVLANGPGLAVGLLAIMAMGAVAVPLNPGLAPAERAQRLQAVGARAVIGRQDGPGAHRLEAPWDAAGALFLAPCQAAGPALDAALILFTSGTTSRPKGVPITHGNLLANAAGIVASHGLGPADTALCILPMHHINGIAVTLLSPLLAGHPVVLPERFSASAFWDLVVRYDATWFSAVPTILSILLSRPIPPAVRGSRLRFARSASAALPVAVLERFEAAVGVPVIESYGISEAGGQVTVNPVDRAARRPGSVGRPVVNRLRIVDPRDGRDLPAGGDGEVWISGPNVVAGYLDDAQATAAAFAGGWFRTGDLGHLDADGFLHLTGRSKELINRAGEKIAPQEIEEILYRLPEIEAAGVTGVPDPLVGEEIAAFITLRPGRDLDPERVRRHCALHLAAFKVPRHVAFVDDLPKGPNGKLQRRRLRELMPEPITADQPAG